MPDTVSSPVIRPFLDVVLDVADNPSLPEGYDTWGFKITRPDLRTFRRQDGTRFRWPWPGGAVTDNTAVANGDPCPTGSTGGFCVALDLTGAHDGGYGYGPILLLAYRQADILGRSNHKLRVRHCLIADLIDAREAYKSSASANLTGANLTGANLIVLTNEQLHQIAAPRVIN